MAASPPVFDMAGAGGTTDPDAGNDFFTTDLLARDKTHDTICCRSVCEILG